MATRTIDDWKERLITILIRNLFNELHCSFTSLCYIITAFVDELFLNQTLLFMLMYLLGTITAIIVAKM